MTNSESPNRRQLDAHISGMTCASCTNAIEKHLKTIDGVQDVCVNLIMESCTVQYIASDDLTAETLCNEIDDIGYTATLMSDMAVLDTEGSVQTSKCVLRISTSYAHTPRHTDSHTDSARRVSPTNTTALLPATQTAASVTSIIKAIPGVLSVTSTNDGQHRIIYDPHIIGGRRLLKSISHAGIEAEHMLSIGLDSLGDDTHTDDKDVRAGMYLQLLSVSLLPTFIVMILKTQMLPHTWLTHELYIPIHSMGISIQLIYVYVIYIYVYEYVCVYIYMHINICVYKFTCVYVYARPLTHAPTHTVMYAHTYIYTCTHKHAHTYTLTYTHTPFT